MRMPRPNRSPVGEKISFDQKAQCQEKFRKGLVNRRDNSPTFASSVA